MNLNKATRTATICLCLIPQMSWAQKAAPQAPGSQETASSELEATKAQETLTDKAMVVQEKNRGFLGDFRVGPHAGIALGVPHLLNYGIDVVYADLFGLTLNVADINTDYDAVSELRFKKWDLTARWFVYGGSFFLGAAYGHQRVIVKDDVWTPAGEVPPIGDDELVLKYFPAHLQLDVDADYLTPHLGWFARLDWGLTLGFELGLQIQNGTNSKFKADFSGAPAEVEAEGRASKEFSDSKSATEKFAKKFSKSIMPYISLLKIGYLF